VDNVVGLREVAEMVAPSTEDGKVVRVVPPKRQRNADVRSREHLTPDEVERLMAAAGKVGRHGHRDATLLMIAYRHGLRVSELTALRWDQIDMKAGLLHVRRMKNGTPSTHPLRGPEIRALRRLRRESDYGVVYVFMTERGSPITTSTVRKMIQRAGELAGLGSAVRPHMLRHSTGYKLANDAHDTRAIQHYLGHKNIQHTVRYTEMSPQRFNAFWED
jgi:type 1 fimbriae regulatory protein FimB